MSECRVGLAVGGRRGSGVLLGPADEVLARSDLPGTGHDGPGGLAGAVAALLDGLLAAGSRGGVARIVLATSALTRPLGRPGGPAPVGVLRIGAPAGTSVPPFTRWPAGVQAAVRGPVAMVRGGHEYDGREALPLDVAAVEALGRACHGVVGAVAVTAIHAHANPSHEELAAAVLGDILGPGVPVVTGGHDGGIGLLERENTAILDAALLPRARRAIDEVAEQLSSRGITDELYLMRGDGNALPSQTAVRRPLQTLGALHGSARRGGAHLAGEPTAVVVDVAGERVRVSASVDGQAQESGMMLDVAGIRTTLRELRVAELRSRPAGAGALLRAVIDRAGAGPDATLVVVGEPSRSSAAVLPATAVHPADAAYAAPIGAAVAEAAGSIDRIFWFGERSRADSIAQARQLAEAVAVRAGADPRRLRVPLVREALMTYVPVPCVRLRVTAVGPIMSIARRSDEEPW